MGNNFLLRFLYWVDLGIALVTQVSSSSASLGGLNLYSAICIAKQRARSEHRQLGNNVASNANEIISQSSKQQLGDRFTFHVSNKTYLMSENLL